MGLSKQRTTTRSFIAEHILSAHSVDTGPLSKEGCMICEAWFWLIEKYSINEDLAHSLLEDEVDNPLKGKQDG